MKKIIDEYGRVFGKVSVIDFLVVLIVLVFGAALYVKYNVLEVTSVAGKTDTITYAITIYGAREFTAKGIQIGDAIYDKSGSGGHSVGTITGKTVTDAKKIQALTNGTIVYGNYEGRYDITLTITASGAVTDGRYLVNKTYEVNTNSIRIFYTKYSTFEATITEIL
jgi:archaellum component FlaF (FlaF/FlaG flagellin family)